MHQHAHTCLLTYADHLEHEVPRGEGRKYGESDYAQSLKVPFIIILQFIALHLLHVGSFILKDVFINREQREKERERSRSSLQKQIWKSGAQNLEKESACERKNTMMTPLTTQHHNKDKNHACGGREVTSAGQGRCLCIRRRMRSAKKEKNRETEGTERERKDEVWPSPWSLACSRIQEHRMRTVFISYASSMFVNICFILVTDDVFLNLCVAFLSRVLH